MVTHMGSSVFVDGHLKGAGLQHLQKNSDPYLRANALTYSDQIRYSNIHGTGACLLRVNHTPTKGPGPSVPQNVWDPLHTPKRFDLQRPNFARY